MNIWNLIKLLKTKRLVKTIIIFLSLDQILKIQIIWSLSFKRKYPERISFQNCACPRTNYLSQSIQLRHFLTLTNKHSFRFWNWSTMEWCFELFGPNAPLSFVHVSGLCPSSGNCWLISCVDLLVSAQKKPPPNSNGWKSHQVHLPWPTAYAVATHSFFKPTHTLINPPLGPLIKFLKHVIAIVLFANALPN